MTRTELKQKLQNRTQIGTNGTNNCLSEIHHVLADLNFLGRFKNEPKQQKQQ